MPPLSEQDARAILEKTLKFSRAESCEANVSTSEGGNIRFARNTVTTAGSSNDRSLVVQSNFGKRSGTATVNQFDDASIERAVRRSEELAQLAPEDPEFLPPLPQQQYLQTRGFLTPPRRLRRTIAPPPRPRASRPPRTVIARWPDSSRMVPAGAR